MNRIVLAFLSGLALSAAVPHHAAASDAQSARAFIESIYHLYVGPEGQAPGLTDWNAAELFDARLAELIIDDLAASASSEEPPHLNGDPFVGAQDWVIESYDVTLTQLSATDGQATFLAEVSFVNMGEPETVRLHLLWSDGAWRIAEIEWDYARLTEILTDG